MEFITCRCSSEHRHVQNLQDRRDSSSRGCCSRVCHRVQSADRGPEFCHTFRIASRHGASPFRAKFAFRRSRRVCGISGRWKSFWTEGNWIAGIKKKKKNLVLIFFSYRKFGVFTFVWDVKLDNFEWKSIRWYTPLWVFYWPTDLKYTPIHATNLHIGL